MNKSLLWCGLGAAVVIGVMLWAVRDTAATQVVVDQCDVETAFMVFDEDDDTFYTFGEVTNGRLQVDFNGSNDDQDEAVITAGTGYAITDVEWDSETSGDNWQNWTPITGVVTVNPPGTSSSDSGRVDKVRVKVKKVCTEVCNDDSATNYQSLVPGQTQANNDLCTYPTPTPTPTPSDTPTPTPSDTPTPTPECDEDQCPTPTPTPNECDGDCETPTPTATPEENRRSGGGSGGSYARCSVQWLKYVHPNDPACVSPTPTPATPSPSPTPGPLSRVGQVPTGVNGLGLALLIALGATGAAAYLMLRNKEN